MINIETLKTKLKILPICIDGNPVLRLKCGLVYPNFELRNIVDNMFYTLDATKTGVGMASSQVGIPVRLFILGGTNEYRPMQRKVFINPKIILFKGARRKDFESCLSVPGITARVERWQKIKIKYYDLDFNEHIELFKSFEARVIQHELDHLDGIQFYDRISKVELEKIIGSIEGLRRGEVPKLDYKIKCFTKTKTK